MKGMTDHLIAVVTASQSDLDQAKILLGEAVALQVHTTSELLCNHPESLNAVLGDICADATRIETLLHEQPDGIVEQVAGMGEVWSARTMGAYLHARGVPTAVLDARDVLIVAPSSSGLGAKGSAVDSSVEPLYEHSAERLHHWWNDRPHLRGTAQAPVVVVTGFVASTRGGVVTTLKRSGSDLSATIFARLLEASRVTLWKNVDGVLSADPTVVPDARSIPVLSFTEARELAYFGSQVLHPAAMEPLVKDRLPLFVRNVFNPANEGTKISAETSAAFGQMKAVSAISSVAMIHVHGGSWGSVTRILGHAMLALDGADINVVLVTQSSAEHSVALVVDEGVAEHGVAALRRAFEGQNAEVKVQAAAGLSLVTVLGDQPACTAARLLASLSKVATVHAVAQGSSACSSSVVVERVKLPAALRAVHAAFSAE
jgi:aspartokinase/homoserine dehydrogenase 1